MPQTARKSVAEALVLASRACRKLRAEVTKPAFAHAGRNLKFDALGSYTYSTIYLGHDVALGPGAVIWATSPAYVEIRDKVMFGPNVTILAGDHVFDIPGVFMADITDKRPGDDRPVIIERDVWVGANCTILKGVTVGRGSVIAAGSVVTKSVPPFSVVAGVPARRIRARFTAGDESAHDAFLGPESPIFRA